MALTKVSGDFIQDGSITQGHLHASHGITTSDIGEGSNLYFTTARVNTAVGNLSTSDLSEGANLYYTQARFNTAFAAKSTSDLSEGTNLYYTDTRVGSYLTTNSYATQSYVNTQVSNLVDSAPSTLDTLNELAAALGDDANFSTTVTNSIATKLPLAGGTLTGKLTISQSGSDMIDLTRTSVGTYRLAISASDAFSIYDVGAAADRFVINTSGNVTFSGTITASGYNDSNWNTAYGWGDHANGGYLASSSYTAADVLTKIKTVDGSGSGLDADLLDGVEGNQFLRSTTNPGTAGTNANTTISIGDNGTSYAYVQSHGSKPLNFNPAGNTVQINGNRILTVADEGSGNGLDADTVDGQHASAFASSSHTHAASDITSGNLAAARNTANLVNVGSTSDASGIYFRSVNEVISGEGWATAQYAYNENDGFLFLNRNSSNTAFPTFHIGGWNNAGYISGYSNADGLLTLTRSDGSKSQGSTYAGTGLSNTSYYTNIIKTTAKTVFRDAQGLHEFTGGITTNTTSNALGKGLKVYSTVAHQYPQIYSNGTLEAMWNYKNNAAEWYVGIRTSAQLLGNTGFHFYNTSQGQTVGGWDINGHSYSIASSRAPIFYDSNDTNYYIDPASTSRTNTIISNVFSGDISTSGDGQNNYPFRLRYDYNAWMMAAASNTWGLFWAGNSGARYGTNGNGGPGNIWGNSTNPNEFVFVGGDSTKWTVYGNSGDTWQSGYGMSASSFRAPIFYDSNNTSYYLDPASLSYISQIRSNSAQANPRYDTAFYVLQAQHWYGDNGSQTMFLGEAGNAIYVRGSMYSPIYYDYNNTSYYLHADNLSNLHSIDFGGALSGSGAGGQIGRNHAYDTLELKGYGAELMIGGQHPDLHINYRTCNNGAASHTPTTWYWRAGASNNWSNHNFGNITSNGIATATGSHRAPIFYDSNDTTYYMDYYGGGILRGNFEFAANSTGTNYYEASIELRESNRTANATATPPFISFHWGGVVASSIAIESNGRIAIRNNPGNAYEKFIASNIYASSDFQGPIYYDSNNTGYYVNADSTSNLYHVNVSQVIASDWLRTTGNTGWYNNTYGGGIYMVDSTYVRVYNGKRFYNSNTEYASIYSEGGVVGVTQMRAPIYYDNNNTGYYVDPAGWSNLSSGRIGSYLQIGTTGNTSHTPGINMGIGSDIYWRQSTYSNNADIWMESIDNATYLTWNLKVSSFDTTSWTDSIVVFNHNFWRGYVGILRSPEYPLDLNGQARLSGGYTTSDVRLKKNIRDNELGLSHLLQLRTRLFDWITDEEILGRTLAFQNSLLNCRGFIAQEVEEVVPELVDTSEGDQPTKSIDDGAVTAMMVKAIQEQQAIIDDLKARIEILENQ